MINASLDFAYWRAQLQREGRVQIDDYLQPQWAQRLQQCLIEEVPWTLALRDEQGPRTIAHEQYAAMSDTDIAQQLAEVAASARGRKANDDGFRFVYESYMMVRAYKEGRDPGLLLHRVLELFNTPEYVQLMHELTGDTRIRRHDAQATRYRPGHFLRHHTDIDSTEGRRYAYVLNLTREWQADWGGLLQFVAPDGRVLDTFRPRWNTLSLFAVPAGHVVSLVAPWAEQDRLAITGWCLL